jgi:DNA repair ATPase RecN
LALDGGVTNSLLVITGATGAGKTSILSEASDILALRHIVHAAIDVDALGLAFIPPFANNDDAMYANLRCVCKNYAALGVQRFLLARAVEDRGQLEVWRNATSATETVVCRLISSIETMQRRIQIRETGVLGQQYIDRVAKLNLILDHARLEGFR